MVIIAANKLKWTCECQRGLEHKVMDVQGLLFLSVLNAV